MCGYPAFLPFIYRMADCSIAPIGTLFFIGIPVALIAVTVYVTSK